MKIKISRRLIACALLVFCGACKPRVYEARQSGNQAVPTPSDSAPPGGATATTNPDTTVQSQIDDSAVTARAKSVLASEPSLKGAVITVETRQGTGSLSGTVLERTQRYTAEHVVRGIQGVRNVDNRININH